MSKSREGLFRSLLSDFVRGLSRSEDPDTVEGLKRVCGVPSSDRSWRLEELKAILQGLASSSNTRLFLLVDALDECEPQHHLRGLADDILWISKLPNVKLCISCRPWTQFTGRFRGYPILYLDQLTYQDMIIYLKDRLKKAERDCDLHDDFRQSTVLAQRLIQRTVRAAEGVFLWLELVTRALECELNKGSAFEVIDQVVTSFPVNLNDYFLKLTYERIPRSGKNVLDTATVLELAWLIEKNLDDRIISPKNFVNFWLLLSGRLERGFSWSCNLDLWSSQTNIQRMLEETRVFLAETCKDLLVFSPEYSVEPRHLNVVFVHRTAFDFLCDNRASFNLQNHTPEHFYEEDFLRDLSKLRDICLLSVDDTGCLSTEYALTDVIRHATFHDDEDDAFLSTCEDIAVLRVQHKCKCDGLGHLENYRDDPLDFPGRYFRKYVWEVCNQWPHLTVTENGLLGFETTGIHERKSTTSGMALLRKCLRSGVNPNAEAYRPHRAGWRQTYWGAWLEDMWQKLSPNFTGKHSSRFHDLDNLCKTNIRDCIILMLRSGADPTATVCIQEESPKAHEACQFQPLDAMLRSIFSLEDQTRLEELRVYCSQISVRYHLRRKRKLRALKVFQSWEEMLLAQTSCNETSINEVGWQDKMGNKQRAFLETFMGLVDSRNKNCEAAGCTSSPTFIVWCVECECSCAVCERCGFDPTGFGILSRSCEKWQCSSVSPTHEHARIILKREALICWHPILKDTQYGVTKAVSELKSWYDKVVGEDPTILDRLDDDLVLEQDERWFRDIHYQSSDQT